MAYRAGQLIQNVYYQSLLWRHSPLLVVGQNISVKHGACGMTIRFFSFKLSVLVVFICRLDTIAGGCGVFIYWKIRRITFAFFSSRLGLWQTAVLFCFTPPRRDKDKETQLMKWLCSVGVAVSLAITLASIGGKPVWQSPALTSARRVRHGFTQEMTVDEKLIRLRLISVGP